MKTWRFRIKQLPIAIFLSLLLGLSLWLLTPIQIFANDQNASQNTQISSQTDFLNSLNDEERSWLKAHPRIRVAQDPHWPPIEFVDENGKPSGISNDYLKLIEQRLGVTFELVNNISWQESYSLLKTWDIDMTTSVAVTEEREKFWVFTKPYMTVPIVILTRSDVTYISSISELKGHRVAVEKGHVAEEWIHRDHPEIELIRVENVKEGIGLLQGGDVFAFIDNMLVIGYYLAKLKSVDLKIAGWTPYVNAQAMAVRKDWPVLASILQKALDSIPESQVNGIYKKWVPLRYEHGFDYGLAWKGLAIAFLIIGGLLLWNRWLSREITNRHDIENALRASEKRYRDLWEKAPVMMISLDTEARIRFVSDLFCDELGYERSEVIGRTPFEFQTAESAIYSKSVVFPEFVRSGVVKKAELQLVKKNGEAIDVLLNVTSEHDAQGNTLHSRSVYMDVTDQKQAQRELLESQRMYEDMVSGMPGGVYRLRMKPDRSWKFDFVSDRWCELNGLEKNSVLNDPLVAFTHFHPDDKDNFIKSNEQAHDRLEPFVWEGRIIVNNEVRYAHIESKPRVLETGDVLWNGVQTDITASKRAEEALRENEGLLRGFFDNAEGLVWVKDLEGRFLKVNNFTAKAIGLPEDKIIGRTIDDLPTQNSAFIDLENDKRVLEQRRPMHFEEIVELADGTHTFLSVKFPLRNAQGDLFGLGAICSDITDRKNAEMELRRLESAIDQAAEVVIITQGDGTILYVNPAFEKTTGYRREEVLGRNTRILRSADQDDDFYADLWNTITQGNVWEGRFINRRKDGKIYYEDATISPVRDSSGKIINFVAVKRDVTEHLELSNKLQQAQKMEAVGALAGGVAHDFNNILQVALGYTEILLDNKNFPEKYRSDINKIRESAIRGADLVKRLMTFSRKSETKLKPLDLNRRIMELRKILERTIPKMIKIQLELAENLETIKADPTQMDQILMNLTVNARDAMPEGGVLKFQTENISFKDSSEANRYGLESGNYVMLKVSDNGLGIDKSDLDYIFDPFFTTKDMSHGTGLGLSVVRGVVESHGGNISCESAPGEGTVFTIFFPAVISSETEKDSDEEIKQIGGGETILLVDDDQMVRELCVRVLNNVGYKVIEASDGESALKIYKGNSEKIDLVILDLIMPGMGGKKCLERMVKFNQSVKVIVASGYYDETQDGFMISEFAKGFVAKPYDVQQMLKIIREVLNAV
ncbi:MAG: PAS domain S-box protein [Desulfomonilaceae bacterium]